MIFKSPQNPVTICYLEDDIENYRIIKDQLECHGDKFILMHSMTCDEFKEVIVKENPEIVMIDIMIEGRPLGISMLKWVRKKFPGIKCMVVSAYKEYILECAKNGALGYLLKDNYNECEKAVKSVYNNIRYFEDEVGSELARQISEKNSIDKPLEEFLELTVRERMILCFIRLRMTYRQMSELLGVSMKTVRNQAQALLEKVGVHHKYDAYLKYMEYMPNQCPMKKCDRKVTHSKFKYEDAWCPCFWPIINMTVKCPLAKGEE
jgi:DNA-binding NarL/FixJ family response regulator